MREGSARAACAMLAEARGGDANRDGHFNGTAGGLATSIRSDLKQKRVREREEGTKRDWIHIHIGSSLASAR